MMSFFKQTISSVPLESQTVLLRTDYNVPLDKNGQIDDDFRIKASLPTIRKLLEDKCKVVIISHLGRPEGRDEALSLEPVADRLAALLGHSVRFCSDTVGDKARMAVKRTPVSSVIVLENLRYFAEEEANDDEFAKKLAHASGARYFVQDGFGVVHRAHASTAAITQQLPSVAGLLLEKEYISITNAMEHPKRPLVAVLGGAKIKDKIGVIEAFVKQSDKIIIGGAMANTFLFYKGYNIGKSKYEANQTATLDKIYAAAADKVGRKHVDEFIVLPTDVAVARKLESSQKRRTVALDSIKDNDIVLDAGDASIEMITQQVSGAKTVVWNGTLGYAEFSEFSHGSARLALALATQKHTTSIIGGGDTADFVLKWDANHGTSFSHVSTGGGASLELMAGEKLPGIESLLDARK